MTPAQFPHDGYLPVASHLVNLFFSFKAKRGTDLRELRES